MKFNEEEDNLSYTDHQESIFRHEHDDLLTELADLIKACLSGRSKNQAVADDILDIVEGILDFAGEIMAISISLYASAELAQAGAYDAFDMSHEVFGSSDYLLDIVLRADKSSKSLLAVVHELIDSRGGRHEQG